MSRILILILICTLYSPVLFAQFTYEADRRDVEFSTSYQAILDPPSNHQKFMHGAKAVVSWSVANKFIEKQQRGTQLNRIIDRNIYLKGNLSTYKREQLHQALIVSAGTSFRITLPEGVFFEFEGGLGYMRTFLKGDHFVFEQNEIAADRLHGNNLLSIHTDAHVGWNFYKSHKYPVVLFSSIGLMTYFPNNDQWLIQPVFNAGLGFVLVRINEEYINKKDGE